MNETGKSAKDVASELGDQLSSEIQTYVKTSKDGKISTEGFKASIGSLSLSAKLSAIGMNLLSTALNVSLTFAVTTAIQLVYQFVTAQKQLQKAAAETGSAFAEKAKDIDKHYITKKS